MTTTQQTGIAVCIRTTYRQRPNGNELDLVEGVLSLSRSCWAAPGFVGTQVLRSEKGDEIQTISQWRSYADYEAASNIPSYARIRKTLTDARDVEIEVAELLAVDGR